MVISKEKVDELIKYAEMARDDSNRRYTHIIEELEKINTGNYDFSDDEKRSRELRERERIEQGANPQ
jgi:hypothetical protein